MIEDVFVLGKEYTKIEGEPKFIQNPNVDYAIIIELKRKGKELEFCNIKPEEISNWKKYMYRRGRPNQYDFTPSSKLTKTKKTLDRLIRWAKNNEEMIKGLGTTLQNNKEKIEKEIEKERTRELDGKSFLITITIDGKYLNEILSEDYLRNKVTERLGEYENYSSKGNGICIFCGHKGEVFGMTLPEIGFQFYNVDKPGFAPGFKQEWSYKQVPICNNCSFYLLSGKNFLDKYLKFETGVGFNFYVIPSFIFKDKKAIKEFIEEISSLYENYEQKGLTEVLKGLITEEDLIYEIVKEISDSLKLNFLFFVIQNKRFLILSYVSDVKPSWLRKIYEVQTNVANENILYEDWLTFIFGKNFKGKFIKSPYIERGKKKKYKIIWWIFYLNHIISSQKEFIGMISSILQQKKINYSTLLHKFNLFLQNSFKKKNNLTRDALQTLSIYLFLDKLNLLRGEEMNSENKNSEKKNILNYPIFSNDERKHTFLVGALANYVLFIQRTERGNEPFRNKLNNLIIDQNKLRKIFVECVEKLNQYRKPLPSWLPENFDKILNAPEKWKSSVDEISYFFTLGLTLGNILFKYKKQSNNEGDEDDKK